MVEEVTPLPAPEPPTPEPTKYFGYFLPDGSPRGFWNTEVFPNEKDGSRNPGIPVDVVEITKEQWEDLISDQPWTRYINGQVIHVPKPDPPPTPRNPFDVVLEKLDSMDTRLKAIESK